MLETNFTSLLLFNDGAATPPMVVPKRRDEPRLEDIAAKACRATKLDAFTAQFERLLAVLRAWLSEHGESIQSAHLTVRERDLLFVVVQKDARFSAELADLLTELDIAVAEAPEFVLIDMEVLTVPPLSAESLRAVLIRLRHGDDASRLQPGFLNVCHQL
jgi:hypothetical protein